MLEFFGIFFSELLFYLIIKPVGVFYRWMKFGFRARFMDLWEDHPRENYPAGAFVMIGIITAIGVIHIIRDARL